MLRILSLILVIIFLPGVVAAQSLLQKQVSLQVSKQPLKNVLNSVAKQGGFYFSYNSKLVKEDSMISITANGKTVKQVLDQLFNGTLEYRETEKHIILQKASGFWYVSGYIMDGTTGERLSNASVYDKNQLVASLTNDQGYFRLKLKERTSTLSVSKAWYTDTSIVVKPGQDQEVTLNIQPKVLQLDSVTITPNSGVERNWLGNLFLSSRQRMQSMNLSKFFVDKPYQASLTPGLGTHGRMSAQVVNKFSFNVFGGYTAGVNGFEIGGLFNIVKKDMHYAQIAGVFNVVGGNVDGLQIAGLHNNVMGSMEGVQLSGISSMTAKRVYGIQVSGVYSHTSAQLDGTQISGVGSFVRDTMDGVQVAGVGNYARATDGVQVAGVANVTSGEVNGVQVAGVFNFAKRLDGVQVGIINVADTSSGYSIGLINFIWKGYHKICISTNEVTDLNVSFKTGNKNLYSILLAGMNTRPNETVYTAGYGVGSDWKIWKGLHLNPEFDGQVLYNGDITKLNTWNRLHLHLNYHIGKYFSVFAGPTYNVYYAATTQKYEGYKHTVPSEKYNPFNATDGLATWIGWSLGVNVL